MKAHVDKLPTRQLRSLHLFAGAGGGILADLLLGHRPVCAVEIEPYCQRVLAARQRDGILPFFPIWDDIKTFDGKPWRGSVDIVAGGFPCQGVSGANPNAKGLEDPRSALWFEMVRVVREVGPRYVLVENSPMLTSRGLGRVLRDLAEMGYNARWGVLSAADAIWLGGTPCLDHLRERIWIVATAEHSEERCGQGRTRGSDSGSARKFQQAFQTSDTPRIQQGREEQRSERQRAGASGESNANNDGGRCDQPEGRENQFTRGAEAFGAGQEDANRDASGLEKQWGGIANEPELDTAECDGETNADGGKCERFGRPMRPGRRQSCEVEDDAGGDHAVNWWESEPRVGRVANGVESRVDRLAALGNGQVPLVAAIAWKILGPDQASIEPLK